LNEFADSTLNLGESLFKRIEEVGNINEKLKVTADKIANKGAEIGTSFFKRTKESITQINSSSIKTSLKERASTIGGKLWGVRIETLYVL